MNKRFLFYWLFFNISIGAIGQEVYTLEKCIEHALKHNLDILQAQLGEENAELDLTLAKHAQFPNVSGSANFNMNFGRSIDPVTNSFQNTNFTSNTVSLSSGIVLYNFGRLRKAIKQGKINLESATYDTQSTIREISLLVAQNYINALFAEENLKIAESQLSVVEEQLSQINKLIRSGSVPAADALEIEAQLASSEQTLIGNINNLDIALLKLKQSIRLPIDKEIALEEPEEIAILSDPELLDFEEVWEIAVQNEPGVKSSELQLESALIGIDLARSSLYPSLILGGSLGTNYSNQSKRIEDYISFITEQEAFIDGESVTIGFPQEVPLLENNPYFNQLNENLSYGFGLQLNIPIYNNYSNRANVQRARINHEIQELNKDRVYDQLETQIKQALSDAKAAKKTYEASHKTLLTREAAYKNAEKKFNIGNINAFELMSIRNNYEQSQINALIAKYDYYFANKVLDFYMGKSLFTR